MSYLVQHVFVPSQVTHCPELEQTLVSAGQETESVLDPAGQSAEQEFPTGTKPPTMLFICNFDSFFILLNLD